MKHFLVLLALLMALGLGQALSLRTSNAQFLDRIVRPCTGGAVPLASVIVNPSGNNNINVVPCTGGSLTVNGVAVVPGGGVAGTGTINTLPIFTAATTIGNSKLTDPGSGFYLTYTNAPNAAAFALASAKGTVAVPTKLLTGDTLGILRFAGYDDGFLAYLEGADIRAIAEEDFDGTGNASQLLFNTMSPGGVVALTRATLDSAGMAIVPTWNNGATDFVALTINATNTASGAGALLLDVQRSTTSVFSVSKFGNISTGGGLSYDHANQTLTVLTSANQTPLTLGNYSLLVNDASSLLSMTGTWNTTGAPKLIFANVLDTASDAASLLLDLQVSSVSKFSVSKAGAITVTSCTGCGGITNGAGANILTKSNGTNLVASLATDDATTLTYTGAGGIVAPFYSSAAANPADAGAVRLGTQEKIAWENVVPGTDLFIQVDANNLLQSSAPVIAPYFGSQAADIADAGVIRLGNTELIAWENAVPGIDLTLGVNGSNLLASSVGITAPTMTIGAGAAITSSGAGGALGSNAFTSTAYLPLAGGTLTGALLFTDNTLDIGAAGATRPRTGYFGTSLVVPIIAPPADSTTALKITKADGVTSIVTVDSTNARVGINKTPAASFDLDVNGATSIGGGLLTISDGGGGATLDSGYALNANGSLYINYNGYQEGTTRFRSLNICNGKAVCFAGFDGTSNNISLGTNNLSPGAKVYVPVAPSANANYGMVSLGSGKWDGATSGFFVGSGSGTTLAINNVSGYAGNLIDAQVAGVSEFKITAAGAESVASIAIGGGTAILKHLSATGVLDFANLAAIGCEDLTITVTGAALGDTVDIGIPNGSVVANGTFTGWVSATNTVSIRFCTVVSGDPASGTFRADVWQH
jgi:hypothetical protein